MTCKGNCLSYDVCPYHIDEETEMTVNECGHFKNKADFVEVPCRCKECKHCEHCYPAKAKGEEALEGWYCNTFRRWKNPDDFCSCGERK